VSKQRGRQKLFHDRNSIKTGSEQHNEWFPDFRLAEWTFQSDFIDATRAARMLTGDKHKAANFHTPFTRSRTIVVT
jgi:hypothetical protein